MIMEVALDVSWHLTIGGSTDLTPNSPTRLSSQEIQDHIVTSLTTAFSSDTRQCFTYEMRIYSVDYPLRVVLAVSSPGQPVNPAARVLMSISVQDVEVHNRTRQHLEHKSVSEYPKMLAGTVGDILRRLEVVRTDSAVEIQSVVSYLCTPVMQAF